MKYHVQFLRRRSDQDAASPIGPDQILEELTQFSNDVEIVIAQAESLTGTLSNGDKADGFRLLERETIEIYRWWRV